MNTSTKFKATLVAILLLVQGGWACSMYKLTANGKTMVGNNEDSWRTDPRIWFEPASAGKFGAAYVGYAGKPHPDGGVNEYGLAFDGFTVYTKTGLPAKDPNKKNFTYNDLKTILQQCKTVDDVYAYLSNMNLHYLNGNQLFNGGMLLFIDKSGKYLVAEADKLTLGTDPKFLLANFSVADTKDLSTIKMERYCKGVEFTKNGFSANAVFARGLSDAMSVNRPKAGDGTLYTTIYDLNEGIIYAYFFHDYTQVKTFNLKHELAKGEHGYQFAELFPGNAGFKKFTGYKTPQNSKLLFWFMVFFALLFFFSAAYFGIGFIRSLVKRRASALSPIFKISLSLLCLAMGIYAVILLTNQPVFYFASPYYDDHSVLVTAVSYLPFVLVVILVPLIIRNIKLWKDRSTTSFSRLVFTTNNLAFTILSALFIYWGFFDVFH